jgi:hypothetical protein
MVSARRHWDVIESLDGTMTPDAFRLTTWNDPINDARLRTTTVTIS